MNIHTHPHTYINKFLCKTLSSIIYQSFFLHKYYWNVKCKVSWGIHTPCECNKKHFYAINVHKNYICFVFFF